MTGKILRKHLIYIYKKENTYLEDELYDTYYKIVKNPWKNNYGEAFSDQKILHHLEEVR
jgi:hypothetical protein